MRQHTKEEHGYEKNILKRMVSVITILVLSVTISLNNIAYSSEFNIESIASSSSIELKQDIRVQDDFYNAVNMNGYQMQNLNVDMFLMEHSRKYVEKLMEIYII